MSHFKHIRVLGFIAVTHKIHFEEKILFCAIWINLVLVPFDTNLGPVVPNVCSKLPNVISYGLVKFSNVTVIPQISQYFLSKKCEKLLQLLLFFLTKNIFVFG